MIASIFIFVISLGLLAYWLRYSCVFLLRSAQERSQLVEAPNDRFNLRSVMDRLKVESDLAQLELELDRDYAVISYLIQHAADLQLASIENRLLVVDYKLMRVWSRFTRKLAPQQSRQALSEMASVLGVLVSQMGANGLELNAR
jgi:hypothetical protein